MPVSSKRVPKPDPAPANPNGKTHNPKQLRVTRTVRIIYSDPNATESSSDDEQYQKLPSEKRCVKVIRTLGPVLRAKRNPRSSTSKYVGVRQRKTGRWVAEIKDPFRNTRHWLGTFNSEEEAHSAYEKKRVEFQNRAKAMEKAPVATSQSPISVLETPNAGTSTGVKTEIEKEGEVKGKGVEGFLGNSGGLFDELKEEDFLKCNLGDVGEFEGGGDLVDLDGEDFGWLDEVLKSCG